jgi:hypothetical protein
VSAATAVVLLVLLALSAGLLVTSLAVGLFFHRALGMATASTAGAVALAVGVFAGNWWWLAAGPLLALAAFLFLASLGGETGE